MFGRGEMQIAAMMEAKMEDDAVYYVLAECSSEPFVITTTHQIFGWVPFESFVVAQVHRNYNIEAQKHLPGYNNNPYIFVFVLCRYVEN